jgi:hypothetical protein
MKNGSARKIERWSLFVSIPFSLRSVGQNSEFCKKLNKQKFHAATILIGVSLLILTACAKSNAPVSVTDDVFVVPPKAWSVIRSPSSNPTLELVFQRSVTDAQGRAAVAVDARATITVENRRDHAEAVRRLAEIAIEIPAPTRFLTIDGWPAMQRRYSAPLPQTLAGERVETLEGETAEKCFAPLLAPALHTTTAVAADVWLVRVEGVLMPGVPETLAQQIEEAAQTLTFSARADRALTERDMQDLSGGALRKRVPALVPPPGSGAFGEGGPAPDGPLAAPTFVESGSEVEIAVSANGQNVVIGSNSGFSNSIDGGHTFTFRGGTPGTFPRGGDPSLGWGPSGNGNFYYSFIGFPDGSTPAGNGCAVSVAKSTNNGDSFNWIGNAAFCPLNGPSFCLPDNEHLAVDRVNRTSNGDEVYVVWRDFTNLTTVSACTDICAGPVTPKISCSVNGGTSWATPTQFGSGGDFPRVTVGPDGFVYVVLMSGENIYLYKFSSCADGLALQPSFPAKVATKVSLLCPIVGLDRCNEQATASTMVAVDDADKAHVFVAFATSTSFGTDRTKDNYYLTNDDIIVRDSRDGGVTWLDTDAVVANADVPGRRFMPWVCAASGAAQVSWYDRRSAIQPIRNDLTAYFRGTVVRSGGTLNALAERNVSGANDPQCASGWPCRTRNIRDSDWCSKQPQLAGLCLDSNGGGSRTRCDFDETTCPTGETCKTGRGCPKYGDYNGNACAAGRIYTAWASATPPTGVTAPAGISVFADVSSVPPLCGVEDLSCCVRPPVCKPNLKCSNGTCVPPVPRDNCAARCHEEQNNCLASDTGWSAAFEGCLCYNEVQTCLLGCGGPHAPLRQCPKP